MPRDGSGIYTLYPGTDGVSGQPVLSTPYNSFIHDVETDLNTPRPIVAGGTGSGNAAGARDALDVERSMQTIANFDLDALEVGSFMAGTGATGSPVAGHAFAGIVFGPDNNNLVINAYDRSDSAVPGRTYTREKKAGVWGAWNDVAAAISGVRYDIAQSLTLTQQEQARKNMYAAPFDALAYNGMQVNGGVEVDQWSNGGALTLTSGVVKPGPDCWRAYFSGGWTTVTIQQTATTIPGLPKCVTIKVAAGANPGASDQLVVAQFIEGYRVARLGFGAANASPVTFGFYVFATVATNLTLAIGNAAGTRSYVANVPVSAPNTWEFKTVTVPGDVAGTWLADYQAGLTVTFTLAAGSSFVSGAPNAWNPTGSLATSSQGNFFPAASVNNVVSITGLVALPGNEAPIAARVPYIMRSFGDELLKCMRYFEKSYDYASIPGSVTDVGALHFQIAGLNANTTNQGIYSQFRVPKRTTPAVAVLSPKTGTTNRVTDDHNDVDITPSAIQRISQRGFNHLAPMNVSDTFATFKWHFYADARF